MSDTAKMQMVRIILHWAWDPIGVRGIPEAIDEYDTYAPKVLEMLRSGGSDQDVGAYLTSIVRDRMELRTNPKADEDIAAMLRELYAIEA